MSTNQSNQDYMRLNDHDNHERAVHHEIIEEPHEKNAFTSDKIATQIRLGFIRKVFGILTVQSAFTTFLCLLSMVSESFFQFQQNNLWLLILAFVGLIAIPCFALCNEHMFKKFPQNYIWLGVFTICESYLVSIICAMSNPSTVLMAACMTLAISLALFVYAATTKNDLTLSGSSLFLFCTALIIFGIFAMFTDNPIVHVILASLGAILFGLYLIYDVQLIMGNKQLALDIDDYVLASLMLYVDIIGLFIKILELLRLLRGE